MQDLNELLSRIQTDYEFYLQFQKNPQEVLKRYELSAAEEAVLTESGERLSSRLRTMMPGLNPFVPHTETSAQIRESRLAEPQFNPTTQISLVRTADSVFDPKVVLTRSEVKQSLAEIRSASTRADRLTPMLALMEEIG